MDRAEERPVHGRHAVVKLFDRLGARECADLLVHIVRPAARVVPEPNTKVFNPHGTLLLDLLDKKNLAVRALDLAQAAKEIPEARFRYELVGREDGHLVQLGYRHLLRWQLPPDYLVFLQTHDELETRLPATIVPYRVESWWPYSPEPYISELCNEQTGGRTTLLLVMLATLAILRAHKAAVASVAFSDEQPELASGDADGWVIWWSVESRRPLAVWRAHEGALLAVIWLPQCRLLTHGRDNRLKIWDMSVRQSFNVDPLDEHSESARYPRPWLLFTMAVNALNFCAAAVSAFGLDVLVAVPSTAGSETVDLYEINGEYELKRRFRGAPELCACDVVGDDLSGRQSQGYGIAMALAFQTDSLVIGFESGHVVQLSFDGSIMSIAKPHTQPVLSLAIADGAIYTTGADRLLVRSKPPASIKLPSKGSLCVLECERQLAVACWDSAVRFYVLDGLAAEFQEMVDGAQCIALHTSYRLRALKRPPPAYAAVGQKNGRVSLLMAGHGRELCLQSKTK